MATRTTIALEDDLDGGPADETVRFMVDSTDYEVDLNEKNAAVLRRKLAPFVEHPRRAGRGQRRRAECSEPVSVAARSGPGRKTKASRSAAGGASRRVWLSSTKSPRKEADPHLDRGRRR